MKNRAATKIWRLESLKQRRHGVSLIELVVMASVTSMMLVVTTSWIHQTMKQSTRFKREHREQLSVSQLSRHFRKHVWASSSAKISDPNSVTLTNPLGDLFTYRMEDQQIQFVHQNAAEDTQAMERFALPSLSNVTFEKTDRSVVVLKVETSLGEKTDKTAEHAKRIHQVVEATVARWLPANTSSTQDSSIQSSPEETEALK